MKDNWLLFHLEECKRSLERIRELKKTAPPDDRRILKGMERDLDFAIRWLENGGDPGPKRTDRFSRKQWRKRLERPDSERVYSDRCRDDLTAPWGFTTEKERAEFRRYWDDWGYYVSEYN